MKTLMVLHQRQVVCDIILLVWYNKKQSLLFRDFGFVEDPKEIFIQFLQDLKTKKSLSLSLLQALY